MNSALTFVLVPFVLSSQVLNPALLCPSMGGHASDTGQRYQMPIAGSKSLLSPQNDLHLSTHPR